MFKRQAKCTKNHLVKDFVIKIYFIRTQEFQALKSLSGILKSVVNILLRTHRDKYKGAFEELSTVNRPYKPIFAAISLKIKRNSPHYEKG